MSDEEDYMSDQFLAKLNDIRPSLILDRGKKRLLDVERKRLASNKLQKEELGGRNARLQLSLKKAIGEDNKGFKLLAKMGYKPGQALGKQSIAQDNDVKPALTEPIPLIIKDNRSGLGRESAWELGEKRRILTQKRMLEKLSASEPLNTAEFRKRVTERADLITIRASLRKCQITCESLDEAANVSQPKMVWFWPESFPESQTEEHQSSESQEDTETECSSVDKLEMLTKYLRTAYLFCFWCGLKYEDTKDLNMNCPGLTRDEH